MSTDRNSTWSLLITSETPTWHRLSQPKLLWWSPSWDDECTTKPSRCRTSDQTDSTPNVTISAHSILTTNDIQSVENSRHARKLKPPTLVPLNEWWSNHHGNHPHDDHHHYPHLHRCWQRKLNKHTWFNLDRTTLFVNRSSAEQHLLCESLQQLHSTSHNITWSCFADTNHITTSQCGPNSRCNKPPPPAVVRVAGDRQINNEQTDRQTEGHHHCIKPPPLWQRLSKPINNATTTADQMNTESSEFSICMYNQRCFWQLRLEQQQFLPQTTTAALLLPCLHETKSYPFQLSFTTELQTVTVPVMSVCVCVNGATLFFLNLPRDSMWQCHNNLCFLINNNNNSNNKNPRLNVVNSSNISSFLC